MIYFASKTKTYAMNMHAGMQDVIDGSRAYFESKVGFNADASSFDIRANLSRFEFALNMPLMDAQDLSAYIKIVQDGKTYYAFVTDYSVINDKSTLIRFTVDWWHTSFVGKTLPTLARAWVSKDNKHYVSNPGFTAGKNFLRIMVGEGEESVNPLQLQELATTIPQGASIESRTQPLIQGAEVTHDLDDRLVFIRIVSSKLIDAPQGLTYVNSPLVSSIYNSLYVGYILVVNNPAGVDTNTYTVQATQRGSVVCEIYKAGVGEVLSKATGWLSNWAKDPNTVSIDVTGYMPVIQSIEKKVSNGLTNYFINFIDDYNNIIYLNPEVEVADPLHTTFTWLGDLPTPDFYTPLDVDNLNSLNMFTEFDKYAHTKAENDFTAVFEPKLAQPQYSTLRLTNYKSEGVQINPYNAFSALTMDANSVRTRIKQSYNEPTAQSGYSPLGALNGKMLTKAQGDNSDYRDYMQIDTELNELPVITDQYLTYMQNKRNSFETGYALSMRQEELRSKYALVNASLGLAKAGAGFVGSIAERDVGGAVGGGIATAQAGANLAHTIESNKFNRDALQQTHNAFIADLKNAVKGVKGGNNAVFAVERGDLWLTWELWTVTAKDRARLHRYFKYNGYSVNETQENISLDSMYYFDYIEADNIAFNSGLELGSVALTEIRNKLSNGVRIWHERGNAFIETTYMNTAKEY